MCSRIKGILKEKKIFQDKASIRNRLKISHSNVYQADTFIDNKYKLRNENELKLNGNQRSFDCTAMHALLRVN